MIQIDKRLPGSLYGLLLGKVPFFDRQRILDLRILHVFVAGEGDGLYVRQLVEGDVQHQRIRTVGGFLRVSEKIQETVRRIQIRLKLVVQIFGEYFSLIGELYVLHCGRLDVDKSMVDELRDYLSHIPWLSPSAANNGETSRKNTQMNANSLTFLGFCIDMTPHVPNAARSVWLY